MFQIFGSKTHLNFVNQYVSSSSELTGPWFFTITIGIQPRPNSFKLGLKKNIISFRLVLERRAGKEITEPSRFYSKQFCLLAINIISKLKLKLRLKPRGCNVSNI